MTEQAIEHLYYLAVSDHQTTGSGYMYLLWFGYSNN